MSNIIHFNEPDVDTEICGLDITFEEVKVRGEKGKSCRVFVKESGAQDFPVMEYLDFESWEDFLKEYPKPIDLLKYLAELPQWESRWRQYERAYYISSSEGHKGLYKFKDVVWFDAREEFGD